MPARARHRGVSRTLTGGTLFRPSAVLGATAALTVLSILFGCAPVAPSPRRPIDARAFTTRPQSSLAPIEPANDEVHAAASRTYLLLRLQERRVYMVTYDLRADGPTEIESFPVAIGRKGYETPTGIFVVTDKVADPAYIQFDWDDPSRVIRTIPPGPDNPLGRRWIEFASGDQWQIGFHGTPNPEFLGQAVSHGCVRMRNDDVVKVYDHVRVGTLVIVQP